jgi:hypothetical protein
VNRGRLRQRDEQDDRELGVPQARQSPLQSDLPLAFRSTSR